MGDNKVKMDSKLGISDQDIDWGERTVGANRHIVKSQAYWTETLLKNAQSGLPRPVSDSDTVKFSQISGECHYYHYGCDGQDDQGWGCGYRTVQSISSWLCLSWSPPKDQSCRPPPSLPEIQQALVDMGDKPRLFSSSRGWIGTFEAALVLDYFYDVPCRVVHVRGGGAELEGKAVEELHQHFQTHGSPVMMGGDRDNSSKGILGVCTGGQGSYLLVMDPHYHGSPLGRTEVQGRGWVSWKKVSTLDHSSFYNLCLPQTFRK
ncbi:inactive Ufm1-specific protease 1 [Hypomesus transpacificus]|uniref:inactive Ufm1-specific protease 1 n=1 Tax=Hypomesus transpacificus TaxID=137520 RepID=UPI001F0853DB|nr:inactive Ufm1-specific protease 1 [Hypomesus transpacificus]